MSDGVLQKPELWTEEEEKDGGGGKKEQLYLAAISHYQVSRVFRFKILLNSVNLMNFWVMRVGENEI